MRRILALGCCALYLTFGSVAGLAHVHESGDHHEQSRGLHLDHGHLGDSSAGEHRHGHAHHHEDPGDRPFRSDARHVAHHEGDAVYLNATAARSVDPGVRLPPALVSEEVATDPPSSANRMDAVSTRPRDPPRKSPPRLRAPPA